LLRPTSKNGFGEAECTELAGWICDILDVMAAGDDTAAIEEDAKAKVETVCARLPVYR